MTAFNKKNFFFSGDYTMYQTGDGNHFIARFKYGSGKAKATHFMKFLIKNFTVEEYLGAMALGKSPIPILAERGYVSLGVKINLVRAGYSPNQAGVKEFLGDQAKRHAAT